MSAKSSSKSSASCKSRTEKPNKKAAKSLRRCDLEVASMVRELTPRTVESIIHCLEECLPEIPEGLPRPEGSHSNVSNAIQAMIPLLSVLPFGHVVHIRFAVERAILDGAFADGTDPRGLQIIHNGLATALRDAESWPVRTLDDALPSTAAITGSVEELPTPIRELVEMLKPLSLPDQWIVLVGTRKHLQACGRIQPDGPQVDTDGYDGWLDGPGE